MIWSQLIVAASLLTGDLSFVEVSSERGIGIYDPAPGLCTGVSAADYDNDGDIDLFVPTVDGSPDQLYENDGSGNFTEVAALVGVDSTDNHRAAVFFDFDGDGRLDLFVAGDCRLGTPECLDVVTLKLYRQLPTGLFDDVTAEMGFTDDLITTTAQQRGGVLAADVTGDGYVDLVTGIWTGEARVFKNDAGLGFTDISLSCGIGGESLSHWQPVAFDFDGDGLTDIFWAIDFTENRLWRNTGDGTFVDVAADAGVDVAWNDMGVTLGDYDGDGDFDVFVTEVALDDRHNLLLRNDSDDRGLTFSEVAIEAGVGDARWGWGATFMDADHDGLLDLAATNGFVNGQWSTDESVFFRNKGGDPVTFDSVGRKVGFDDHYLAAGLISFDLDNDGDLDLAQICSDGGGLRLLENQLSGQATNSIKVRPRMDGPNSHAIGAIVRISTAAGNQVRHIHAGTSMLSQEPAEAHFGLRAVAAIACLTVEFPDGTKRVMTDVAVNQTLTVWAGDCHADLDCSGTVDFVDLLNLLSNWGPCLDCPADLDGSGHVSFDDLLMMLSVYGPLCSDA